MWLLNSVEALWHDFVRVSWKQTVHLLCKAWFTPAAAFVTQTALRDEVHVSIKVSSTYWLHCVIAWTSALLCLVQTLDRCGAIDILVSNAAVNPFFGNIMDSTEEVWDKVRTKNEPIPIICDVRHKFAFFQMKDTVALICCHNKQHKSKTWFWWAVYVSKMITREITLLFKVFTVTVSTFSDPGCERKISLPHDQAGGASYREERVSDSGTQGAAIKICLL